MFHHRNQKSSNMVFETNHVISFKTAALSAVFLLMLLAHAVLIQANAVYARADSISDSVLRLRVIANSDSKDDQELKLIFKSRLCEVLKPYLADCKSVDSAADWIRQNLDFIQDQADRILDQLNAESGQISGKSSQSVSLCKSESITDSCTVQFTRSSFPIRTYGDLTFPPGNYRTLLVTLGSGQGHNWWCVLYPALCFTDETTAAFSEEAQTELQQTLTREDYSTLTQGVTFRLRIAEILQNLRKH